MGKIVYAKRIERKKIRILNYIIEDNQNQLKISVFKYSNLS